MDEFLLRMLPAPFRRNIDDIAFQQFQHGLLNALSGNVPGDGRIVALPGYLVDLIDEDDTPLCLGNIVIRLLKQSGQDAFNIFSHITCLCENRGIDNREGNIQQFSYRPGKKGLARSGRSHQQDIGFLQFHVILFLAAEIVVDPLVVIVDRHSKHLLRAVLSDDIFVKKGFDLCRFLEILELFLR